MELQSLVNSLGLLAKDSEPQEKALRKALSSLSGDEILDLHEELVVEAVWRVRSHEPDPVLCREYDSWTADRRAPTLERLENFRRWLLGFHAYAVLCGLPPLHTQAAPGMDDEPYFSEFPLDTPFCWMAGNSGLVFLEDVFPLSYEIAGDARWPREIRGASSTAAMILFINPKDYNSARQLPSSLRCYWDELDRLIADMNHSRPWAAWLRSTPFRQLEVDCGTRDWCTARRKSGGHFSGSIRKPRQVVQKGFTVKLGIAPVEEQIFEMDQATCRHQAHEDLALVFENFAKRFGLGAPPAFLDKQIATPQT